MQHLPGTLAVLQLTDTHFLAEAQQKMLGIDTEKYFVDVLDHALANHQHYDIIILSGDLAQDPCPASYERLRMHLTRLAIPVVCLPGNHDDLQLMQTLLNTDTISCAKQRVFKHWQLICLNSQIPDDPGGFLAETELVFLKHALEDFPQLHALIAVHHHCVPALSEWIDTMIISNSNTFLSTLKEYPQVKVIITGHIHQELSAQVQHFSVFGTPSTCFQFTPKSRNFSIASTAPGYRKLWLSPDGAVTTEVCCLPITLDELKLDGKGYAT